MKSYKIKTEVFCIIKKPQKAEKIILFRKFDFSGQVWKSFLGVTSRT